MSQAPSQIRDLNLVSIPFIKFSHNTSPCGSRNFIWNHIGQRDDLDLVIQNSEIIDEQGNYATRITLKITAGVEVLETQDLGELINFVRRFDSSSATENPVQVVIRCPFMAMKYPKTINLVRRIQLKFRDEGDFRKALDILKDLGLPITESSASVSRPSISPAQLPFPPISTPILGMSASNFQPPSAHPSLLPGTTISPIAMFKVPTRPDTRNAEIPRSDSTQSFAITSYNRSASASTALSAPTPPSSVSTLSPLYDMTKPHSLLYPVQHRRSQDQQSPYPTSLPTTTNDYANDSFFAPGRTQLEFSNETEASDSHLAASPFFPSRPPPKSLNPSQTVVISRPQLNNQTADLSQGEPPQTNPFDHTDIHNDWLPPRRELPFPKFPVPFGEQVSSASDLPLLPKPTPVRKTASPEKTEMSSNKDISTPISKPIKKRVAQRKSTVRKSIEVKVPSEQQCQKNSTVEPGVGTNVGRQEDELSPLAAKSDGMRPPSAISGLQSKSTATRKRSAPIRPSASTKRPRMVDQSTQTQILPGYDITLASLSANEISTSIPPAEHLPAPPQDFLDILETFITRHQSEPAAKELWDRPGYAQADEEQRQRILNEFICENLENPEFVQLCEDAEKTWRRMGLGM